MAAGTVSQTQRGNKTVYTPGFTGKYTLFYRNYRMFLKDEEVPVVDIVNNQVRGVDGISSKAFPRARL